MEENLLYRYIPPRIFSALDLIEKTVFHKATELRIRKNMPSSLTFGNRNIFFSQRGELCGVENAVRATAEEIKYCVSALTKNSRYAYEDTICRGFIPLENGYRAGVCGNALCVDGKIKTFTQIDFISIRKSVFYKNAAKGLYERLMSEGLKGSLVISPPGSGKTTYLRSIAYLLSSGNCPFRVCIADERREIFVKEMEPCLIDCISDCPKEKAVSVFIRTMSPQVIICDEIGNEEGREMREIINGGVCLIASCHGKNLEDASKKPYVSELLKSGVFENCVELYYENGYKSRVFGI